MMERASKVQKNTSRRYSLENCFKKVPIEKVQFSRFIKLSKKIREYLNSKKYNSIIIISHHFRQWTHEAFLQRIQNVHIIFFGFDQFVDYVISFFDAGYDSDWNLSDKSSVYY